MPSPNLLSKTDDLIARTERMRQEALAYQIEHAGKDDSYGAMIGEIDCLIELCFLRKGHDHQDTKTPSGPERESQLSVLVSWW